MQIKQKLYYSNETHINKVTIFISEYNLYIHLSVIKIITSIFYIPILAQANVEKITIDLGSFFTASSFLVKILLFSSPFSLKLVKPNTLSLEVKICTTYYETW